MMESYEVYRERAHAEMRRSPWYQVGLIYARSSDPNKFFNVPAHFFQYIEFQLGTVEGAK